MSVANLVSRSAGVTGLLIAMASWYLGLPMSAAWAGITLAFMAVAVAAWAVSFASKLDRHATLLRLWLFEWRVFEQLLDAGGCDVIASYVTGVFDTERVEYGFCGFPNRTEWGEAEALAMTEYASESA